MRILTVRQPWAWAIIHGGKDVENRTRNIAGGFRGPVAIHAGKRYDFAAAEIVRKIAGWLPDRVGQYVAKNWTFGAIIGVVDLIDVHNATVLGGCGQIVHDCPEHGTCRKHCSVWADGPNPAGGWYWHFVLANPRPLPEPILYKGALGLRELPPEVEAQIWEALG